MSYSEIVDKIQGDVEVGANYLIEVAEMQKKALAEIKEAEKKVQDANDLYKGTMREIELVCKHLGKSPHFRITKDKKYYHFNKEYQVRIDDITWEL